jgi:hypothetical protein
MPRLLALQTQRFGRPPRKRFPVLQSYFKQALFFFLKKNKKKKHTKKSLKKTDADNLSAKLFFFFLSWVPRLLALQIQRFGRPPRKRFPILQSYLKQTIFFRPCGGDPMKGRSSQEGKVSRKNDAADAYDLSAKLFFSFFSFHLLALQTQRFGRPPRKRFPVLQSYLKQTSFFVPVGGTP